MRLMVASFQLLAPKFDVGAIATVAKMSQIPIFRHVPPKSRCAVAIVEARYVIGRERRRRFGHRGVGVRRMKNLLVSTVTAASIIGMAAVSTSSSAKADGTVPDYDFAATGVASIGGSFLDGEFTRGDLEVGRINWAGRFVIPVTGRWNIQLSGEGITEYDDDGLVEFTNTQFWASGAGFWRDRDVGTLGIEAGLRSEGFDRSNGDEYVKIGGFGELYQGGFTIGGSFGALVPWESDSRYDTSFYAKGWANYYFSDQIAFNAFGDWTQYNFDESGDETYWRAGGKVRYKTSLAGTEAFVSGAYTEYDFSPKDIQVDGVQVIGGISINILGGLPEPESLQESDRIFGIDTSVYRFEYASDRRLKTDIRTVGVTESGLKLYSWKYKSDPVTTWVGVMAQDLEATHPEALRVAADGYYRVNYSRLDVQMMTLEQWNARLM